MRPIIPHSKEEAIIQTIAFFSLLHFPLTVQELQKYVLHYMMQKEEIERIVRTSTALSYIHGYCCLRGEEKDVRKRTVHDREVGRRLQKVKRYIPYLQMIPFVRGAFVCNNLSFGVATHEGDIDLFVVAAKKHLYLVRFLVTAFLHFLGVRRHGGKISNRFCLSFYITDDALDLSSIALPHQDIYLAFWVRALIPVFGSDIYNNMQRENQWLTKYFKMVDSLTAELVPRNRALRRFQYIQERIWEAVGGWLEEMIRKYQLKKIARSMSRLTSTNGIVVSDMMLKFHDQDKREEYQLQWGDKIRYITSL